MRLTGKNILLISPEPWDHIFVSKHHYAVQLGRNGNQVFFLGPPTNAIALNETGFANVLSISYKGFPKGLRLYPAFVQRKIIRKYFDWLQRMCSCKFDIVWSFDNSVFFDFSSLPDDVMSISHIVDLNQDFQTRRAAVTADFCFCTTEHIRDRLLKYNSKVHKINHGFYIPQREVMSKAIPTKTNKLRAVYAGNLAMPFIDWSALYQAVRDYSDCEFLFVGPNAELLPNEPNMARAKQGIRVQENCHFTGRISFEELSSVYRSADVLLVAYREEYWRDQANPHKVMEYLGSGKVVVATYTSEYADLTPLIVMSKQNSHWPSLLGNVLTSIDFYNSEDLQERRRVFAANNSYDAHIRRIEQITSSAGKLASLRRM